MVYLLISISVIAMTVSQLLLKKGVFLAGQFPQNFSELIPFFLRAFTNTYVISAIFVTIIAALAWILALPRVSLSFLYPFMSISYVLIALFSWFLFKEDVTMIRWAGIIIICLGVFLVSRS